MRGIRKSHLPEAGTAVPSSHIELDVSSARSKTLRSDRFVTIKISCLRVMPQFATVKPLIAVIIHLSSKCYTWWEGTIAQSGEGANARYFVDVSYKKHVTLLGSLCPCQGQQNLIEKGVPMRECGIIVSPLTWS